MLRMRCRSMKKTGFTCQRKIIQVFCTFCLESPPGWRVSSFVANWVDGCSHHLILGYTQFCAEEVLPKFHTHRQTRRPRKFQSPSHSPWGLWESHSLTCLGQNQLLTERCWRTNILKALKIGFLQVQGTLTHKCLLIIIFPRLLISPGAREMQD